ncbi:MAG: NADH-quinone oxidoreductase subunit N [Deltaproteobacteria bacterium]|jgi:NADH-quinone oxidoreductase subunit N|nr:MAG: NADH-quinone oxidoreductase subunit N [Deltaproteobacteria bacterium]
MLKPITLEIVLVCGALGVFFMDLFLPSRKKKILGVFVLLSLVAAMGLSFLNIHYGSFFETFINDPFSISLKRIFLLAAGLTVMGSITHSELRLGRREGEYYFLLILSLIGMMIAVSARELLLLFVGFELMSVPLYVLSGFDKRNPKSVEGALKVFLFGTVSSSLLLLGIGLFLATAGTTRWIPGDSPVSMGEPLGVIALAVLFAGFGFKIAAFPFQFWVPDTYEGAPTPFVAFLSVAPKVAGFGIIFRFFFEALEALSSAWTLYAVWLSALTMIVGNLLALPQRNVKRLLAYSGIAHVGYILLGLASGSQLGLTMSVFYFIAYLFSNMGAFLVAEVVHRSTGSDDLDAYRNLNHRSPFLALAMLVFLLSLGGIPFVIGFWAKLYIFLAAIDAGYVFLVFLGALLTVVALFYYLNLARKMYIDEGKEEARVSIPFDLYLSIGVCAAGVVLLGIYPKWVVQIAEKAVSVFLGY